MLTLHNHLAHAVETLELLGEKGRYDFMVQAANETNGYFKPASPKLNWDSQRVEIKAHSIYAEGSETQEAIRNWQRAARAQCKNIDRLNAAEALLYQPAHNHDPDAIRAACRTIIDFGPVGATLTAARATLKQIEAAA